MKRVEREKSSDCEINREDWRGRAVVVRGKKRQAKVANMQVVDEMTAFAIGIVLQNHVYGQTKHRHTHAAHKLHALKLVCTFG